MIELEKRALFKLADKFRKLLAKKQFLSAQQIAEIKGWGVTSVTIEERGTRLSFHPQAIVKVNNQRLGSGQAALITDHDTKSVETMRARCPGCGMIMIHNTNGSRDTIELRFQPK